jgi:hypothetical protein
MSGKRFSILLGWKLVLVDYATSPPSFLHRMTMTNAPCKDKSRYDCEGWTCKRCFIVEPLTPWRVSQIRSIIPLKFRRKHHS